ncbi:MAG: Holliday junction branch migration protein RuvA [Opitutae bacterium]|nr:Holliday junction branch migration protein RuvA [Opitutae bacterium]MDG1301908.1 Holliday junction branch migration protein RuvA [Opitutae bacterium]
MIARIKGIVLETTPLLVVIEAGGVGYDIQIPITTAEKVPGVGKECSLFIHSVYREDSASLYGFATRDDRDFFRLLVEKVSGIGPKIGIAILSRMSVELLRGAIASADIALLSKCPGIGKKTAERLVIELKDKVALSATATSAEATDSTSSASPGVYQDAVSSLIILGYKPADADKFVRKASSQLPANTSVEALVKQALS